MEKISEDELLKKLNLERTMDNEILEQVNGGFLKGGGIDRCLEKAKADYFSCSDKCPNLPFEDWQQCKESCRKDFEKDRALCCYH